MDRLALAEPPDTETKEEEKETNTEAMGALGDMRGTVEIMGADMSTNMGTVEIVGKIMGTNMGTGDIMSTNMGTDMDASIGTNMGPDMSTYMSTDMSTEMGPDMSTDMGPDMGPGIAGVPSDDEWVVPSTNLFINELERIAASRAEPAKRRASARAELERRRACAATRQSGIS